jgi:hypothetical protein
MFTLLTLGQNTFIAQLIAPEIIALFVTGVSHQTKGSTLAFFWQRLNNQYDQEVVISDLFYRNFSSKSAIC